MDSKSKLTAAVFTALILSHPGVARGQEAGDGGVAGGCVLQPCGSGCPLRCTATCPTQNCAGGECGDPDCKVACGGGLCDPQCGATRCDAICVENNLCLPVCGGSPCNVGCSPCQTSTCSLFCNDVTCPGNICNPNCGDPACKPLCGGNLCDSGCPEFCNAVLCPQNICSPTCGDPNCNPLCGGSLCNPGCPEFCNSVLCPGNICSPTCGDPDCNVLCGGGPCDMGCEATRCDAICLGNNLCEPVCGGSPCNIGCSPCQTPSCSEYCEILICPQNICTSACGDPECKFECGGDPCLSGCPQECNPLLCADQALCSPACGAAVCDVTCTPFGGGPCAPGCPLEDFSCDPLICALQARCDPLCGGDPCGPACVALGDGPCTSGCPLACDPLLCPFNFCDPACGNTTCSVVCGGSPCNPGCPGECNFALCPLNYCSPTCTTPDCHVLCGGGYCDPDCPTFCSALCAPSGGGPCVPGCPDESVCNLSCPLNLLCNSGCGGNPCNVGCGERGGGPCATGCENQFDCNPLVCFDNNNCKPECGGDPCNLGCESAGLGTGPCGAGCEYECSSLFCPMNALCNPTCGGTDCNNNDIADACEIVACRATFPFISGCDDCNLNLKPDQCDIDSGNSLDVNRNGIPDECCFFPGPSLGGLFSDLLCLDKVTIDADAIPGASATAGSGGQVLVTVDTPAAVSSLRLLNQAVLAVSGAADENLTILSPGGITISGRIGDAAGISGLWAANDRMIDASAGVMVIDGGGEYRKDAQSTAISSASLLTGELILNAGSAESLRNGGKFELTDMMSATIGGNFLMNGAAVDLVAESAGGQSVVSGIVPPPPILFRLDALSSASQTAAGTAPSMIVGGSFQMLKEAEVSVGTNYLEGYLKPVVTVTGDFDNQATLPSVFNWLHGTLRLNGVGQVFEVAGLDLGQTTEGFATDVDTQFDTAFHRNFSMDAIEVAAGSTVTFANEFHNTAGDGCAEALYVRELTFRAGSNVTIDNCKVFYGTLLNEGVTPTLLGCAELVADVAPPPGVVWNSDPFSPDRITRTLRLSVNAPANATASPGQSAIKVTMVDLQHPDPRNLPQYPPKDFTTFDTATHGLCAGATTSPNYNGHHCAADAECLGPNGTITTDDGTCPLPGPACTAIGETNPPTANGIGGCARWVGIPGTFYESQGPPQSGPYRASRLQCTPVYWDWASEPNGGLVIVVGAEIIPSSEYSVQTYGASCKGMEATCTNVSAPMTMYTRRKGDLDSPFQMPGTTLTQADVLDISQAVASVKHLMGAPAHYRGQMQPNLPELNADANVLDIVEAVDSVKRLPYSFSGPCVCPSAVTCGGSCTGCTGLCLKTCVGGDNDGQTCINNMHCPGVCVGGSNPDAVCPSGIPGGVSCAGVCIDGTNPGAACTTPGTQCTGGGTCSSSGCSGVCSSVGTCYDKCGRCSP